MQRLYTCIIAVIFFVSCTQQDTTVFKKLSPTHTGIKFSNTITENDSINILNYYYCYNGGGVGIADFNNDGLMDIFFTGNMVSSKLYLNKGNLQFEDITASAGISTHNWIMGVSLVDINNDGLMDVYLSVAGPGYTGKDHNLLYINLGNLKFTEQAAAYGLDDSSFCVQAAFTDYDRDGDLDMYLLTNDVDGVEKTVVHPAAYPVTRGKTVDKLYENIGSDSLKHPFYVDVSKNAGIVQEGYGLGLTVGDFNRDGWPDVYAANDFMPNDQLLINQKDKTFKDCSSASIPQQSYNGMGVDAADINNDGLPDILVLDMLPPNNERRKTMIARADYESFALRQAGGYANEFMRNTLQLNLGNDLSGNLRFAEIAQLAGVHATDWSWSVLLADYDNDGWRDAYITNGFAKNITDLDFINYNTHNNTFGTNGNRLEKTKKLLGKLQGVKLSNVIYRNTGGLLFEDVTKQWGVAYESYSNGAAYADLDNDGDLDIICSNINEPAFVFENTASGDGRSNNYVQLQLKGSSSNRDGLGAAVTAYCGKQQLYAYASQVKGYLSSMNTPIHFGVGRNQSIDSIVVMWPDGKRQALYSVQPNQRLELSYSDALPFNNLAPEKAPVFQHANERYQIHWKHREHQQTATHGSLIPALNYPSGPCIAVGDADHQNGKDFYIGGSAGTPGTLFLQTKEGSFKNIAINLTDSAYEDAGALFFDFDNDKDDDLYVVSGGSKLRNDDSMYQDRLYVNMGKGGFQKSINVLPAIRASGTCVVACDYDKDGDIDVFRAGGISPGRYPLPPRSYLLENKNGVLEDATAWQAPALLHAGMIHAACWTDFDNDGWFDLIVTGEWMRPLFLKNERGALKDVSSGTGLQHLTGWWTSILPADIDNDGDMDYVLGNMGTNVDYSPHPERPLEIFYGDFGNTGIKGAVMSSYTKDETGRFKQFSFHFRDDLFRIYPFLKNKFPDYTSYSKAGMKEIFDATFLQQSQHYKAETFQSCILENKLNSRFEVRQLPLEAQLSGVYGMVATDYDEDGNLDLVITGNAQPNEVVYGGMNASPGFLLKGNGKGNFKALAPSESGLFLTGAMRALTILHNNKGNSLILATANNDSLFVLQPSKSMYQSYYTAEPEDMYAELTLTNGTKRKTEFNFGAGYLSQAERSLPIGNSIKSVTIFDNKGRQKLVFPQNKIDNTPTTH